MRILAVLGVAVVYLYTIDVNIKLFMSIGDETAGLTLDQQIILTTAPTAEDPQS